MSICFMKFFSNVTTLSTMLPWMILLLIHKPDLYKLKAKRKALILGQYLGHISEKWLGLCLRPGRCFYACVKPMILKPL